MGQYFLIVGVFVKILHMTKDDLIDGIFAAYNDEIERLMSYVEALKNRAKHLAKLPRDFARS